MKPKEIPYLHLPAQSGPFRAEDLSFTHIHSRLVSQPGSWRLQVGDADFTILRRDKKWSVFDVIALPRHDTDNDTVAFCELSMFEHLAPFAPPPYARTLELARWGVDSGIADVRTRTRNELKLILLETIERFSEGAPNPWPGGPTYIRVDDPDVPSRVILPEEMPR